jgi:indoleamine 2,3-dioxygenase
MTIHANGTPNSGLLASGQLGDAAKHELQGLDLERKVDQVILSNNQVRSTSLFFSQNNLMTS